MLKRIFWLALIGLIGWLVWLWLRRRQDDFVATSPQFAPTNTFVPPSSPTPPSTGTAIGAAELAELFEDAHASPNSADLAAHESIGLSMDPETSAEAALFEHDMLLPQEQTPNDATETISSAPTRPPAPETLHPDASSKEFADTSTTQQNEEEAAQPAEVEELSGVIGYCVRCKTKRSIKDAHEETTENGRRAARGACPVCGTTMFTFLKEERADQES